MRLSNAGEVLQHVLDCKLHSDPRARVAPAYEIFKVLVLTDELVLHGVPHHLEELTGSATVQRQEEACNDFNPLNCFFLTCSRLSSSHRCLSTFL